MSDDLMVLTDFIEAGPCSDPMVASGSLLRFSGVKSRLDGRVSHMWSGTWLKFIFYFILNASSSEMSDLSLINFFNGWVIF